VSVPGLLFVPSLQRWQYGLTHMPRHIFRHTHPDAQFHILVYFLFQDYAFIRKRASLKAVKTIVFPFPAIFFCARIFIVSQGHPATLAYGPLWKFHTCNELFVG
jgi:hypothetical protein